ncbi:MAG: type II toxin-antitoxin system VapC family toxin [Lentisphaerae bacterium]|nr:type II toxin-antitoxin system VapC family toxin [Lentisphaerota bacterium]
MKAYLDSSSFAKRLIDEAGSDKAEATCTAATALGLSVLCVPEIISALNRRRRERMLTPDEYASAKRRLLEDVRDADMINLTASVIGSSINILEASPVRALDALHIACALEWGADLFVSSDKRQLAAAKRAGLETKKV